MCIRDRLKRYPKLLNRRREIIQRYDNGFKGSEVVSMIHFTTDKIGTGHLYIVNIDDYDEQGRNLSLIHI